MTVQNDTTIQPRDARLAGALYLAIAICGAFAIGYVPSQIVAPGDAALSTANLLGQPGLFRLGVLADSAVILFEIVITIILFQMFRHTSPRLAYIALISRFGMTVVMGVNLMIWVMPFALLSQPLAGDERASLAILQFFTAHSLGIYVWQLFFGTHLLALGAIILRGSMVPHLLGWGLFIGAFGYLVQGLVELTFIDIAALDYTIIGLLVIVTLSELGFGFWLLFKGLRGTSRRAVATQNAA